MISAVEIKKKVWDISCTDQFEFHKILGILCNKLKINLINYSKLSFRASSFDVKLVMNALSENGIGYYKVEKS